MQGQSQALLGREPEDHVAEGMEEGQDAQDAVRRLRPEHLFDGGNVGIQVELGQHHSLGISRAAAAEDDGHEVLGAGDPGGSAQLLQPAAGEKQGGQQAGNAKPGAESSGRVLQIDEPDISGRSQIRLL